MLNGSIAIAAAVELLIRSRGVLHDIESQNAPHGRIVERLDVEDIVLMRPGWTRHVLARMPWRQQRGPAGHPIDSDEVWTR